MRVRAQMPEDRTPPPRAPGWQVGVLGLLAIAAYSAIHLAIRSGEPNGYRGRNWDFDRDGAWPYPTDAVRIYLIVISLDFLLGAWLMWSRSRTSLPARSLLFAFLNFFGLVMMAPLMMHAGYPDSGFFGWLLFASGWGVLFAMLAGIISGFSKPASSRLP